MNTKFGMLQGSRCLAAAAALHLAAGSAACSGPGPVAGTLPSAAWRLCLLASQAEGPALGRTQQQQQPNKTLLADLGTSHTKSVGIAFANAGSTRESGISRGLVIGASAEVGAAVALQTERPKRPTFVLSGRRRVNGDQPPGPPNGTEPAGPHTPGVIDVRLSSELQTAQRSAAPAARGGGGLGAALAAVLAAVSVLGGAEASAAHSKLLPLVLVVLAFSLVCGALVLARRARAGGLQRPGSRHASPGSGKLDLPAPTYQSLGGSSVPSFGSRPNTAHSVGSEVCSPDASPGVDSIMGSTRQVVRFTSAEVLAMQRGSEGRAAAGQDPSPAGSSPPPDVDIGPLKPLCPALVLPAHEAHLQIQLSAMSEAARSGGEFHILGPLGNRLLRVEVQRTETARSLYISMVSASDTIARHARILTATAGKTGVAIAGQDGRRYGELEPRRGGFAVQCPGRPRPALLLVGDAAGLQLAASSGEDGRHLASTNLSRSPTGGDRMEVRVRAGVDTALVLSAILAAVLFN